MGAGRVVEFGSPAELLAVPGGAFAEMVESTGPMQVCACCVLRCMRRWKGRARGLLPRCQIYASL